MIDMINLEPETYSELAKEIVERHFSDNPELAEVCNSAEKLKCVEDTVIHLTYLQQALDNGSEDLFVDYILWAKTLYEGGSLPASYVDENLKITGDVLRERLNQTDAGKVSEIIGAAANQLSADAHVINTFLDPDLPLHELALKYLESLLASDRTEASQLILKAVREDNIAVKDIYLYVFQPCQREVGLLWQTGKMSVAQEHFCTAATQLCMSQLYPFIFASEKTGLVSVITCAEGELHEVGVRMVADLLEMNGWDAFYLGANVPIDSVIDFVKEKQPDVVGISATITSHLPQVKELIEKIRAIETKRTSIMVGGYPFNVSPELFKEIGADAHSSDARMAIETANKLASED